MPFLPSKTLAERSQKKVSKNLSLAQRSRFQTYRLSYLPNPRPAKGHWRGRTPNAAWQLRLIGATAMFDAIGEAGVYGHAAEMKIGFTGMPHGPATYAFVQVE